MCKSNAFKLPYKHIHTYMHFYFLHLNIHLQIYINYISQDNGRNIKDTEKTREGIAGYLKIQEIHSMCDLLRLLLCFSLNWRAYSFQLEVIKFSNSSSLTILTPVFLMSCKTCSRMTFHGTLKKEQKCQSWCLGQIPNKIITVCFLCSSFFLPIAVWISRACCPTLQFQTLHGDICSVVCWRWPHFHSRKWEPPKSRVFGSVSEWKAKF